MCRLYIGRYIDIEWTLVHESLCVQLYEFVISLSHIKCSRGFCYTERDDNSIQLHPLVYLFLTCGQRNQINQTTTNIIGIMQKLLKSFKRNILLFDQD